MWFNTEEKLVSFVITDVQAVTEQTFLICVKCPEGTNETEYIMSLAARANEIQHRA